MCSLKFYNVFGILVRPCLKFLKIPFLTNNTKEYDKAREKKLAKQKLQKKLEILQNY